MVELHDTNNEYKLLGAMIYNNDLIADLDWIQAKHFHSEENKYIFLALENRYKNNIKTSDVTQLYMELKGSVQPTTLSLITEYTFGSVGYDNAAEKLYDLFVARRTKEVLTKRIQELGYNSSEDVLTQIVAETEDLLKSRDLGREINIADEVDATYNDILVRSMETRNGITSEFFPTLNEMTGSIMPGNVISIEAREKNGKTTFANLLALDFAINQDTPTVVFSIEMSEREMIWKSYSNLMGINYDIFRNPSGHKSEINETFKNKMNKLKGIMKDKKLIVDKSKVDVDIYKAIKRYVRKYNVKYVVIDYIGLISSNTKYDNDEKMLSSISKFFKHIAKELDIVICVISQQNRKGDIAGSLGLRRDSDYCFSIIKTAEMQKNSIPLEYINVRGMRVNITPNENSYLVVLERSRHTRHSGKGFLCGYTEEGKFRETEDLSTFESFAPHHTNEKDII
jgi:replicative DNA helicase